MDAGALAGLSKYMARCYDCNGVITRGDEACYVCGTEVPGRKKRFWQSKRAPQPAAPITPISNLLFIASIALTLVSFLSSSRMTMPVSVTLSASLFLGRIIADRCALRRQELALRPVTVSRFDR